MQLGVLTQEQAIALARRLVSLRQANDAEASMALASLQQELEAKCAEARLHPVVHVAKYVGLALSGFSSHA